jgi:predicted acyl esterase
MIKKITLLFLMLSGVVFSQTNSNGKLDLITEFTSIETHYFTMPDGVKLATDVYYPIVSDSVTTELDLFGNTYTIELIKKGTQLFVYDSIGNQLSPNKYQLPMVYTRTPYSKGDIDEFGVYLNMLGFSYVLQDMRGRYDSEGVYLPMYSDGWRKDVYHPTTKNSLDITNFSDPRNGNKHEDGKHSIEYIKDSLYRLYDLDNDGIGETNAKAYNGSIVMFGASALGNTQYQAASTIQNDVSQDGLKGLIPIVATNEHFNSVMQHNGAFRQALVQGWMTGQLEDNIDTTQADSDIHDVIHTTYDYGGMSGDSVINIGVDFASSIKDSNGFTGMYPNSLIRAGVNASFAPINAQGESDPNGGISRYKNLELPIYHLTGWWDIFIDGQLETYNNIMDNTGLHTQKNQKIVIGPWTHRTIALDTVGDIVYPPSVFDVKVANRQELSTDFSELVDGDVVDWLRYLLNYDTSKYLGEPKVLIPESQTWQNAGSVDIRVPSVDFYLKYSEFLNYLGGFSGIDSLPIEVLSGGGTSYSTIYYDLEADTTQQTLGSQPVGEPVSPSVNFEQVPNVRYYVPGPVGDGVPQNANVGNYWASSDAFPLQWGIKDFTLFLHGDGSLDTSAPQIVEPTVVYNHDPDDQVFTVGGGNLVIETPSGGENAGPMNLANSIWDTLTMNRPDVVHFETALIQDSLKIVGVPTAKIYASSSPLSGPAGLTSTDFFVRIIDVYPDGREYFVVEGAVNARARDYAKQLATGIEDITIPYTNINEGQVYEYEFRLLPIAYTFGHNHKLKVLISSSNWPRYQSNPNIPLEDGDFFRRTPGDGKTYTFNSVVYSPRVAEQEIFFSPTQPTQITLPMYDGVTGVGVEEFNKKPQWAIYPNPTEDDITIATDFDKEYTIEMYSINGQFLFSQKSNLKQTKVSMQLLTPGIYFVKVITDKGLVSARKVFKK